MGNNHSSTPDIREYNDNIGIKTPNQNNLFVKYNKPNLNNDNITRKRSLNLQNHYQSGTTAKNELEKLESTTITQKTQYQRSVSNATRAKAKSKTNVKSKTTVCSIL